MQALHTMDMPQALLDIPAFLHRMSGFFISRCADCSAGVHCPATHSTSHSHSPTLPTKLLAKKRLLSTSKLPPKKRTQGTLYKHTQLYNVIKI